MPFKSEKQRRFMWAQHPDIARRWTHRYGSDVEEDVLAGGKADRMNPSDFNPRELRRGTAHEMEHTRDRNLAREIAMDHLAEDPHYYSKLAVAGKLLGMEEDRVTGPTRRDISLARAYRDLGCETDADVIAMAGTHGLVAQAEAWAALAEEVGTPAQWVAHAHDLLDIVLDEHIESRASSQRGWDDRRWKKIFDELNRLVVDEVSRADHPVNLTTNNWWNTQKGRTSARGETHRQLDQLIGEMLDDQLEYGYTDKDLREMRTSIDFTTAQEMAGEGEWAPGAGRYPAARENRRTRMREDSGRENSTAMIVIPAEPPGKNVCGFLRRLLGDRSKLVVACHGDGLPPGSFERMLRAQMPDCEKKLRVMDVSGPSLVDAVNSAERNRHYRPGQALELYCPREQAASFTQEAQDGSLKFDPTVIRVIPTNVPRDSAADIVRACSSEDVAAMHRVLDPHVFSDQDAIHDFTQALLHEATRLQNFMANVKLGKAPWQDTVGGSISEDENEVLISRKQLISPQPGEPTALCAIAVLSMAEFSARTRRGNPNTPGWMVDCEVLLQFEDRRVRWIYHVEKRFPDQASAVACRERLKGFIDGKTMIELERTPKSGKIGMSTFERLERLRTFESLFVNKRGHLVNQSLNEFGTGSPAGSGGSRGVPMARGSNTSSWASGRLALSEPRNHVPEDEEEDEGSLDWTFSVAGRGGTSFY